MSAPPFSTAIIGNDAFLAASPALPVQLMHAALAAGFDAVVPASLGDELVAGETLRLAQLRGRRPVVQCACPFSIAQLCKREANLADVTIPVAPAAVALARALRMERTDALHLTYIGACPGAQDSVIDLQVLPIAFLRGLEMKGIALRSQPDVFTDRLPPDRRRFLSIPGGAPRPDLVGALLRRDVVELSGKMNPLLAVADALFDGGVTMIDPAGAYHCACAGGNGERSVAAGRIAIEQLEPSRASSPIFEAPGWLDLRPSESPIVLDASNQAPHVATPRRFGDAARLDQIAPDPAPLTTQLPPADTAPWIDAPGVRSSHRPAPQLPSANDLPLVMEAHIPPASRSLRAQPIEREVPMAESRDTMADRLADHVAPPVRRALTADDLLRRD